MTLKPSRGAMLIEAVDEIPSIKQEVGFGGKSEKFEFEVPYKFRVLAVGKPVPYDGGIWIECEAKVGDIISHINRNSYFREHFNDMAFNVDGKKVMFSNFSDILGFWEKPNEKTDLTPTAASSLTPIADIFREYEGDRP